MSVELVDVILAIAVVVVVLKTAIVNNRFYVKKQGILVNMLKIFC